MEENEELRIFVEVQFYWTANLSACLTLAHTHSSVIDQPDKAETPMSPDFLFFNFFFTNNHKTHISVIDLAERATSHFNLPNPNI